MRESGEAFGCLALDRADRTTEGGRGRGLVEIEVVTQHDRGTLSAWQVGQGATQPIAVVDGAHRVDPGVIGNDCRWAPRRATCAAAS